MNSEHQQLQGVVRTLTTPIKEIIRQQIKLISTDVDLRKQLSELISEICASYDIKEHTVCDRLLGLESDTGSTPEDVFSCLVLYPAALQYARDPQLKLPKISFYQQYLNPAIQCAWKFLSKSLFSMCDESELSLKVGMIIMKIMGEQRSGGRTRGKYVECPYVPPFASFSELYLCLHQFAEFLFREYKGKRRDFCMFASAAKAQSFFDEKYANSQPEANYNHHLQPNADECNEEDYKHDNANDSNDEYDDDDDNYDDGDKERNRKAKTVTPDRPKRKLRNNSLNHQVENKKARGNNNGNSIMADQFECDTPSHDNDGGRTMALLTKYCKAAGAGWDPEKLLMYSKSEKKLEIESTILRATTLKQIASTLNSAYVKDGKVWMDVLDENKFRNSPLVAAFLLVNLVSKLTNDGRLEPLDVAAGITSREEYSVFGDGPEFEFFLQVYPGDSDRFVNVLALSNYISKEFIMSHNNELNDAQFRYIGNAYLRVITHVPPGESIDGNETGPGITFGNSNPYKLHLSETRPENIMQSEKDMLKITHFVQQTFKECLDELIQQGLKPHLKQYADEDTNMGMVVGPVQSDNSQVQIVHPIEKVPDYADTIVAQATKSNNPFNPHSDTQPMKPENYTKSRPEQAMQILTHCYFPLALEAETEVDPNIKAVTIKHGILEDSGDVFCKLLGCFSSRKRGFELRKNIVLKGIIHGHHQLWGAQGELRHHIKSQDQSKGMPRVVESMRMLRDSQSHRDEMYKENGIDPDIILPAEHKYSNVLKNFTADQPIRESGNVNALPQKMANNDKREEKLEKFEPGEHTRSNEVWRGDVVNRAQIIGLPDSITTDIIALSEPIIARFTSLQCTVIWDEEYFCNKKVKRKRSFQVGCLTQTDEKGCVHLVKPGTVVKNVDEDFGFQTSRHNKRVLSENRRFINIRLCTKNDSTVLKNLLSILNGGKLLPMVMRGPGGAAIKSGLYELSSSDPNVTRKSATFTVASSQRLSSKECQKYDKLFEEQSVINVFFNGIYLGAYRISMISKEIKNRQQVEQELKDMEKALGLLHSEHSEFCINQHIPKLMTEGMSLQMQGMRSPSYYIHLEPLDADIISLWEKCEQVPWSLIKLSNNDIVRTNVYISRENFSEKFGPGLEFSGWLDLLQNNLPLVNDKMRELHDVLCSRQTNLDVLKMNQDFHDLQCSLTEEVEDGQASYVGNEDKITQADLMNIAYYAAAKTTIAKKQCVDPKDKKRMIPARSLVENWPLIEDNSRSSDSSSTESHSYDECDDSSSTGSCLSDCDVATEDAEERELYVRRVEISGLKLLITKPTHPPIYHPKLDPVAGLATIATNSHGPGLGEINQADRSWKERNGPEFLNSDDGFNIAFKATLIAMINPHIILQMYQKAHPEEPNDASLLAPEPKQRSVDEFITIIRQYKWSTTFNHEIFLKNKTFTGKGHFIRFLNSFFKNGRTIFWKATENALSYKEGQRRDKAALAMKQAFNRLCGIPFTSFQIHVIMRNIELCIHEPFGPVLNIPYDSRGHGGQVASERLCLSAFNTTKENLPGYIVKMMNDMASEALLGDDKEKRAYMRDFLMVLGLDWNNDLGCLVHNCGIGKKFDASDTEHMLCMFYTLHQHTLASRNHNSGLPHLDNAKYYPIQYTKGAHLASDLAVLSHVMDDKEALKAFGNLIGSVIINKDLFSVDVDENN